MKFFMIATAIAVSSFISFDTAAQSAKTESIPVSGNCGMCKSKIEKTAIDAGASKADWDADKKQLTVSYAANKTSAVKIQEQIAAIGYDTRDVKGNDEAYKKLHGCCQYERSMSYAAARPATVKADEVKKTEKSCCAEGEARTEKKAGEKSCCTEH